jgi:1A family penicillin-binding protein
MKKKKQTTKQKTPKKAKRLDQHNKPSRKALSKKLPKKTPEFVVEPIVTATKPVRFKRIKALYFKSPGLLSALIASFFSLSNKLTNYSRRKPTITQKIGAFLRKITHRKTWKEKTLILFSPATYISFVKRKKHALGSSWREFRKGKRTYTVSFVKRHKVLLAGSIVFLCFFYFYILKDLPNPYRLGSYEIPLATKVYDRNGKLLYEIYAEQNRTLVKLDEIPLQLRQATIAIEDKDFYTHPGINVIGGLLRAIKVMITKQQLQGGSTITQQLVKTAFLSPERTIKRKLKEFILAPWTELIYSKDEILEMYFNQIPYGGTAWGVDSASRKYFGKPVQDLTLAESALLAGLPQAPTRYSPFGAHPELALARQHEVLRRMIEDGYITKEQADEAKQQQLVFALPAENITAPHFVMYVKDQLVRQYGEKIVEQEGLQVTSTLDADIQKIAEDAVASEVAKLEKSNVSNGAAVVTRPATGEILAMVGSRDYFAPGWGNVNVTLANRQPGSSIKPINYAIGLENGVITPSSVFYDAPTCFSAPGQPKSYCPKNYDGSFHGPVQARFALANSYNIPAVKMLKLNTVETMVASASAFGLDTLKDPQRYGLSLTLGGGEVTMLDMAEAFGTFANAGIRKDVVSILKVADKNGKVLYEYTDKNMVSNVKENLPLPSQLLINGARAISAETAYLISHILLDNGARSSAFGSSSALVVPEKQAVSVKTGTTNDLRDNWTIGYTPNFLTAVWVGNNDNTPMNRALVSGITGAAPIWNKIMRGVLAKQEDMWPRVPDGIIGRSVCATTGMIPSSEGSCPTRYEYFNKNFMPAVESVARQPVLIDKTTNSIAKKDQTENVEMQDHPVAYDVTGSLYCLDCAIPNSSQDSNAQ